MSTDNVTEIEQILANIQSLRDQMQRISEQSKLATIELNNLTRKIKMASNFAVPEGSEFHNWGEDLVSEQLYSLDIQRVLQVESYTFGPFTLNTRMRELTGKGNRVKLTQKETFLLAIFAANLNQFVDREFCLKAIWRENSYMKSRSMDVYICKIRNMISDPNVNLANRHGKGYILLVSNDSEKTVI